MIKHCILCCTFGTVILYSCNTSTAHSGRTDARGGHYNRRTGVYHYHGIGASSSFGVSSLFRSFARSTPRTTARKAAPTSKGARARSLSSVSATRGNRESSPDRTIDSQLTVVEEKTRSTQGNGEKAAKLLEFVRRQLDEGKREIGVKYLRRLIVDYAETSAAGDARLLLKQLRKTEPFRTWIDDSGKFSIKARYLRIEKETVYLEAEDGRVIAVNMKQLSRADRAYVADLEGISMRGDVKSS